MKKLEQNIKVCAMEHAHCHIDTKIWLQSQFYHFPNQHNICPKNAFIKYKIRPEIKSKISARFEPTTYRLLAYHLTDWGMKKVGHSNG